MRPRRRRGKGDHAATQTIFASTPIKCASGQIVGVAVNVADPSAIQTRFDQERARLENDAAESQPRPARAGRTITVGGAPTGTSPRPERGAAAVL